MRAEPPQTFRLKDYKSTPYKISHVELTFLLHPTATRVQANLKVSPVKVSSKKVAPLVLDGEKIKLLGLNINGQELALDAYSVGERQLIITTPPQKPFTLEISTECNPSGNTELSGLYMSNGIYCTQCEAEGFRRITYFYDRPDVLARYRVIIEAPVSMATLLSNGNPIAQGQLADGEKHFAEWDDPHPKPSYLFALVAGDLATVTDSFTTMHRKQVQLGIHVERGKEDRCAWAMASLKTAMRWDETAFKRAYDLNVFNIVAVSDFNMGAMENKGLNIFNDKYILALPETATDTDFELIEAIIAHEYFHNWTGNRITCRDWFQLCLKEGLTVFRDQEFTSDLRSRTVKRIDDVQDLRARQFPEDAGPLRHPPRPSAYIEINNFYTSTVYEKGAELCRMLHTIVGNKNFARGMQLYFRRHDGQAATVEQFLACFEAQANLDLKSFMRWYEQAGTPVVTVRQKYDARRGTLRLQLEQKVKRLKRQKPAKPLPIPLRFGLLATDGSDAGIKQPLLVLTKAKQIITLKGILARPIVSINRGFSAPIVLRQYEPRGDVLARFTHDSDAFNRWEAGQTIARRSIFARYQNKIDVKAEAGFASGLRKIAGSLEVEQAFKAKLFETPDCNALMLDAGKDIDAERLFEAEAAFRRKLASAMGDDLQTSYLSTVSLAAYSPDAENCGRRALRMELLDLAAEGQQAWVSEALNAAFTFSGNMTERFHAMRCALQMQGELGARLAADFYSQHKTDPLLIDKWFAAQALVPLSDAAARVEALSRHEAFTYKTPNRVYALLRNFVGGNFRGFHTADGAGYKLAASSILKLDAINPQVASRLATSFRSWRLFDPARQKLAREEMLGILQTKPLSPDVYEIISRTLAR